MNTNGIDLKDVEAFLAVVEEGSFTAAARRLAVNQSVVSTRVAHLEELLQSRLVDRGARRSTSTPAGAAVLGPARTLIADSENLIREARRMGDLPVGTIEVGASTVPGTFYLPPVLVELRRHAPGLTIDLRLGDSMTTLDALRRGTVELAIVGHEVDDGDVEAETIWSDPVVLVASKQLAAEARQSPALSELPLILRRPGSATRRAVFHALGERGVREADLQIALITPNNEVAREAALAGVGATFVSERAVTRELSAGQLIRLDLLFQPVYRPLAMVKPVGRTLSAGASMLADLLRAQSA